MLVYKEKITSPVDSFQCVLLQAKQWDLTTHFQPHKLCSLTIGSSCNCSASYDKLKATPQKKKKKEMIHEVLKN